MNFYENMQQVQKHLLKEAGKQINNSFNKADQTTIISKGSCTFDNLDRAELVMLAEEEFNIILYHVDESNLTTIGALVCLIWKEINND